MYPLIHGLLNQKRRVLLETNGAVSIARVPAEVHKIVDMKPPGSGEVEKNALENLSLVGARDEVKFVLRDRVDYDWSRDLVNRHDLSDRVMAVTFSPVHGQLDPAVLADWMVADKLLVRLGLQLHKVLWPDTDRGK